MQSAVDSLVSRRARRSHRNEYRSPFSAQLAGKTSLGPSEDHSPARHFPVENHTSARSTKTSSDTRCDAPRSSASEAGLPGMADLRDAGDDHRNRVERDRLHVPFRARPLQRSEWRVVAKPRNRANEMRFPASREADDNAQRCHHAAEARTGSPAERKHAERSSLREDWIGVFRKQRAGVVQARGSA
jgi:hypothetical protein